MMRELEDIRRLGKKLRENLAKCAHDPDVESVHDTRTGTRRLQATLENLIREIPPGEGSEPVRDAAAATMKLLKKIRHEAGPVRDLDVHRKLIEKLVKLAVEPAEAATPAPATEPQQSARLAPDVAPAQEPPTATGLQQQADQLDNWLRRRRGELGDGLRAHADEMIEKLDKRIEELEAARKTGPGPRARKKPPGVVALDSFARLASEMQVLDAANLHDFRKGAKKARYVAELAAQGDAQARVIGETLKKLQDEIGDWHDWLVLADEAHAALGDHATELTGLVESEREKHFVAAMKTAAKLRGRLMGEWLAISRRPVVRSSHRARRPAARVARRAIP